MVGIPGHRRGETTEPPRAAVVILGGVGNEQSETPQAPARTSVPDAAEGPTAPVDPAAEAGTPPVGPGLAGPLLVYTALRLGLIAILTAMLALFMPLIVALLFAIIVQLPLAYVLFPGPRRRVNAAMAAASTHRRAERERLRAALAGDAPAPERPAG
jgi:Protein of unknown function (DUF4229)